MNDPTEEDFSRFPEFNPLGAGGVLQRGTPEWTRDPDWPLFGWETDIAPASPSPKAFLDWLDMCLKPEGLLDMRKAYGKRLWRSESLRNCVDYVCDLRLLLKAYANAWPTLRGITLPAGGFVNVDETTELLRQIRDRLTQDISAAEASVRGRLPTAAPVVAAPAASTHSAIPAPRPVATGHIEGGKGARDTRSKGVPKAEAEVRVRAWLEKHAKENPATVTRDAVAEGTGVSTGAVSETVAWKAFKERRDAEANRRAREVPLTAAMHAVIPGDCPPPNELAALIEEQAAEQADDERRHTRPRGPS